MYSFPSYITNHMTTTKTTTPAIQILIADESTQVPISTLVMYFYFLQNLNFTSVWT